MRRSQRRRTARVKKALNEARAAVILFQANAAENDKIAAVGVIKDRADQDSRGLLAGLPPGQSPTVQKAAADAIASIDNRLALWSMVQNAWYGLSLGSVLLLAAIGLAITFGVMGVINMAHGEMVMLGAYTTFVVQDVIRSGYPGLFDMSLFIAVPLAFLVAGFVGIVIERTVIRFLYGRPLETLLATWGISLILQQAVRTAFGPTNKEVGNPSWMSGAFELGGITITYNRMWIIVFTLAVFVALLGLLALHAAWARNARRDAEPPDGGLDGHPHGAHRCANLRARLRHCRHCGCRALADRQREPEPRAGLHHRLVPGRRVRRRRQSLGHAGRGLHARHREQVPRAVRGRRARQDRYPRLHHPVHPEASARAVRPQGPGGGGMTGSPLIRALDRGAVWFVLVLAAVGILVPLLNLLLPPSSPWHVPTYLVALWGKYVCYALLALSIDLIWGYCGILSLGHGAFFALGGYAMGMYLMRQIGTRGVYGDPIRPDFMVFLNWPELPVYWYGFNHFPYAALMVLLVPGVLAFVFGWFAFRSRVTGVYLSIITQALTFALMLGFFRNNFGFGGNNGLTDFKDILGFNVQAQSTRAALFAISVAALILGFLICRTIVSSKLGMVLVSIRDAEARTRFLGYRVENYKLFVFVLSACMAGVAGALYVPQVGIINPSEFAPANSIEAVIWVAVGGRGTLIGAVIGAIVVNWGKTTFTSGVLAPYWLFVLGSLFVLVTLLLPRGIVGTWRHLWSNYRERKEAQASAAAEAAPKPAE